MAFVMTRHLHTRKMCNISTPNKKINDSDNYEDADGAAPTGDAPTTSEWSTILLPTKVRPILEGFFYGYFA